MGPKTSHTFSPKGGDHQQASYPSLDGQQRGDGVEGDRVRLPKVLRRQVDSGPPRRDPVRGNQDGGQSWKTVGGGRCLGLFGTPGGGSRAATARCCGGGSLLTTDEHTGCKIYAVGLQLKGGWSGLFLSPGKRRGPADLFWRPKKSVKTGK